jgi:hypothetical protein
MSGALLEPTVRVESAMWVNDSRGLFDFEAAGARTRNFDLPGSAKITRVGGSLMPLDGCESAPLDSEPLLQICEQDGAFWVDSAAPSRGPSAEPSSKKLWLVVKDLPGASCVLSEGDTIRMGCSRFRVRQLVADADAGVVPDVTLPDSSTTCFDDHGPATEDSVCRICLEGGCDEHGPLVRPCACRGSIESVHLGCLRQWIRCRMGLMDEDRGSTCFVRQLDCDLCKQAYPSHVSLEGAQKPLMEVPQPAGPFMVLEQVARSRTGGCAGVLVASFEQTGELTFGRANGADFRWKDISISRIHSKISFREGKFILEDNNSRFGTLVRMRRPYALSRGETVSIQAGGAVVSLTLKHDSATRSCPPDGAADHFSECGTEDSFSA